MRLCHGRDGEGATLRTVSPMRRITSSALLSSCERQYCALCCVHYHTHLDVQHDPDLLHAGLCQILEQVSEPRHRLVGLFQRLEFTQKLPLAVDDLLRSSKASFQIFVLPAFSFHFM
jgi:hypothetical protein